MKIGVNARLLYDPHVRGWNRYTINLLVELAKCDVFLFLYTDRPPHPSYLDRLPRDSYTVRLAPPLRYVLWEQRWLPRQCAVDRVEVLHSPYNFGLPWFSPCPRVLTLHDAIDVVYGSKQGGWTERLSPASWYHWGARNAAQRIITVSAHAKGNLTTRLRLSADRVVVIYEAADQRFHEPIRAADRARVRDDYALTKPYIFYVGGWEERKNVPFLLDAFAAARLAGIDLGLAGGKDSQRAAMRQSAAHLDMSEQVRLLGWVPEADLPALYAESLGFVYPSDYEGFGLQLCEAMAVGTAILAADATSLPEVLGSGGDLFTKDHHGQLTEMLKKLTGDPGYRRGLQARARRRSLDFSWSTTAARTLDVYQEVATFKP